MKTLLFIILLILATSMNAPVTEPYIVVGGEKYYYCGQTYDNNIDTLSSPDASIQIIHTITTVKVYNHFGCEGINTK